MQVHTMTYFPIRISRWAVTAWQRSHHLARCISRLLALDIPAIAGEFHLRALGDYLVNLGIGVIAQIVEVIIPDSLAAHAYEFLFPGYRIPFFFPSLRFNLLDEMRAILADKQRRRSWLAGHRMSLVHVHVQHFM